jgi:hypothetical protein
LKQRGWGTQPKKLISDFYKIVLYRTRQLLKFRRSQTIFNVSFKGLPENPTFIRRLRRDVITNVKSQMEASPND